MKVTYAQHDLCRLHITIFLLAGDTHDCTTRCEFQGLRLLASNQFPLMKYRALRIVGTLGFTTGGRNETPKILDPLTVHEERNKQPINLNRNRSLARNRLELFRQSAACLSV